MSFVAVLAVLQSANVPAWFPAACGESASPGPTIAEIHTTSQADRNAGTAELQIDADGSIWARDADLEQWLDRPVASPGRMQDGTRWHSLAQAGVPYRFDACALTLWIAPPHGPERVDLAQHSTAPVRRAEPGGFLNASYFGVRQSAGQQRSHHDAGFAELGLAAGLAELRSQWTADALGTRRLDSFLDADDPARARRLRLGDDITRVDLLGTPVRFAGVRWGTDFSLQPDQPRFPLPAISGQATLPSTLDLYVNGVRQAEQPIEPGAFTVVNPPVYTGGGELQVAVRDATGRVVVYAQPFYVSTQSLARGVADYAVEGGWQRVNFGQPGDAYQDPFGLASWRYGLTRLFTVGARVEAQERATTAGVSGSLLRPELGEVQAALSASGGRDGDGQQVLLGFERSTPDFNVGATATWAGRRYVELGREPGALARRLGARAGMPLGSGAAIGVAYTSEVRRDRGPTSLTALNYSRPLPGASYGFVSWLHSPEAGDSAVLGVTRALSQGRTVTLQAVRSSNGDVVASVTLQLHPPGQLGWDGAVTAAHSVSGPDTHDLQARVGHVGPLGAARVAVASQGDASSAQAEVDSGVAWIGDDVYWTRPVRDSFAIADANAPNVRIYRDNQYVGTTGDDGRLLVPDLQSYEPTRISLEVQDVPLDRAMAESAQEVRLAPGGAVVTLTQPAERFVQLRLVLAEGASVPAGAELRVDGKPADLPVGHEGLVYVSAPGKGFTLEARWAGGACRTDALDPAATGAVTCRSVP